MEYKPIIESNGPPQRHIGILLLTNEIFPITGPTPSNITINNSTYVYCGVSDGMAYYRIKPLSNSFQSITSGKYLDDEVNRHWCINCHKHESQHNQLTESCNL